MSRIPKIAVVGSANVDLTTFTDRFPKPGETIFGNKFDLGFGGKGANQAVAARLCGAEVFMVAKVGADLFGPATIENFSRFGIETSHVVQVPGLSSGVAPIFVESSGQNRIMVIKGANDALVPADIEAALPILRDADCIILQLEIPLETVYYTVQFALRRGIRCVLNPAPAQAIDMRMLSELDYLIPNESEAEAISGMPVRSTEDAKKCAQELRREGVRGVIITLGEKGALLSLDGFTEHTPAYKVAAVDTSGAGDAFIGSFAVFLAEGMAPEEAVSHANLYAALSTTSVGTQKSFYDRKRFESERLSRV